MTDGRTSKRGGNRRRQRGNRTGAGFAQLPWQNLIHPYAPMEILDADQIELIHLKSMDILENIGIRVLHDGARRRLKDAGLKVDESSQMVFFDRSFVTEALSHAPSEFTLHARNPDRNITIGGKNVVFTTVGSAPNCSDLDGGRRTGNQEDYRKFLKLAQSLNIIHTVAGYPVEPVDIHASVRHLDCLSDKVLLTDKVFHAYSLGRERNLDALEITRIGRGISAEQMEREPSLYTIINSNSPLQLDVLMLQGIIEMASRNQMIVLTPFTLAGAMAPVTLAGALAQQNAEALAGISFAQTVRKGAPCAYGGFTSNVDMKSGAPAFGTPEYTKAAMISGQLARRYGLPFRSSNVNASNAVDAQAAYESQMSLWGAMMGHANVVLHGAGWMEGGLTASFEKMIIDVEMLQMMAEFMKPLELTDEAFGLDAIAEAGPGGHFFGTGHTQARYETAFYSPIVSDWRNFESWQEAGSEDATQRANRIFKQLLDEYEAPPIDDAIKEELAAFVAKRKEEGGAPTDF